MENSLEPLENYFPPAFKIYYYNAIENKIIKTCFFINDIKNWLLDHANKKFVLLCLICKKKMNFDVAFQSLGRGRSHFQTKKHATEGNNASCVGVIFAPSQKFVMCLEEVLNSEQLFDFMKKKELIINNLFKNIIPCYTYSMFTSYDCTSTSLNEMDKIQYSMFTYDCASKLLNELDKKCNIADFMSSYITPLFLFDCLLCQKTNTNFKQVVFHIGSRKHTNKLMEKRGVIVSIKNLNIFVVSSIIFLDHLNRYLEEIVAASECIIPTNGKPYRRNQANIGGISTPLITSIISVYGEGFLKNNGETYKFCCLACNDYTKQILSYLSYHEVSKRHKNLKGKLIYTKCEYCNVIYIDTKLDQISGQFKLHFSKHLNDSEEPITYKIGQSKKLLSIDKNFFSFKEKNLQIGFLVYYLLSQINNNQNLTVSFSQNIFQFDNPGVCSSEFAISEKWDIKDFITCLELYTYFTGKTVQFFECITCNLKNATYAEISTHMFPSPSSDISKHHDKENFLKICDICNLPMFSENIKDLQKHFNHNDHLKELSTIIDLPFTADETMVSSFINISRSSFIELIESDICEMTENYKNRQIIFDHLTKDIMALMSEKFPILSVNFYGSRLSGLATNESDFDIFLNLGKDHLHQVEDLLAADNSLFELIVCLSDCAVPIIRAKHKTTGYICEFNLNYSRDHVYASKIIKILTDLDERVLWLLAAVRHWSKDTEIRGPNMFSSHAITWLLLFYLMQPDLQIIPNISYIVDQCGDLDSPYGKGYILRWNPKINKDKTWLELLEGFFNYYSLMKFSEYKLFPSSGFVVPRLPGVWAMDDGRPMYMQDPFCKERNILYNATIDKSKKLSAACYFSLHSSWRLDD